VAPWSAFWDRNFFASALPTIDAIASSPYARGAVSGLGLVTLLAGVADLGAAFASRRATSNLPSRPTLPSGR
jgi:hypothetical protein